MAIYHCLVKIIGRSSGRSSVAASAYRTGTKLCNERDGLIHDYTRKTDIIHSEIITPENTPSWAKDRQLLWNEVEKTEKRKDSQLAREIEVAFPNELSLESRIELVRDYVKENFVDKGMIADIAIHDKKDGNPHSHIMLTTRVIDEDRFGKKEREWNKKEYLEKWRESWAEHSNRYLEKEGHEDRIDHRSYKRQGIEKLPTIHIGVSASAMEKRGIETDRGNINRQVIRQNEYLRGLSKQVEDYRLEVLELKEINQTELKADPNRKNQYFDNHNLSQKLSKEIKCITKELESDMASSSNVMEELYNKRLTLNDYESRILKLKEELKNTSFFEFRKRKDRSIKIEGFETKREEIYSSLEKDFNIQDMHQLESFIEKVIVINENLSDNIKQCREDLSVSNYLIDAYKERYIFAAIKEYEIENDISIKREYKADKQAKLEDLTFEKLNEKYNINTYKKEIQNNSKDHNRVSLDELFDTVDDTNNNNKITTKDFNEIESKLNEKEKKILLSIIKENNSGDKDNYKDIDKKKRIQEKVMEYEKIKQIEPER